MGTAGWGRAASMRTAVVVFAAVNVAACVSSEKSSGPSRAASAQLVPSTIPTDALVGSWGLASYREEADLARTKAMARQQCQNPYVITKGPTDGVMMHVADDPKPYELKLKGSADGKTYLGFEAPPGHRHDREILSYAPDLIVMKFVDPTVNTRYGTFLYVRCSA